MEAIPQGQCLIINNVTFIDPVLHPAREGSDIDAQELQLMFETFLNFEVKLHENVTLFELHQILKECQGKNHTDYNALIIIILSHGDSGDIIYTIDGDYIRLNDIAHYFTGTNCPSLCNKPKVFIIQACRGSKQNQAIPTEHIQVIEPHDITNQSSSTPTNTPTANIDSILREYVHLSIKDPSSMDSSNNDIIHDGGDSLAHVTPAQYVANHADFIYAHATIDEFEALRDRTSGSWFIHELIRAIKKYAPYTDFLSILVKVNNRLSSDEYIYQGKKQVASVLHSCKKDLYFSINQSATSVSSSLVSSKMSSLSSIPSESLVITRQFSPKDVQKSVVATPPLTPQTSITTKIRPKTWDPSTPHPLKGSPIVIIKRHSTSPHNSNLLEASRWYDKRDTGLSFTMGHSPSSSRSSPYSSSRRLFPEDKSQGTINYIINFITYIKTSE